MEKRFAQKRFFIGSNWRIFLNLLLNIYVKISDKYHKDYVKK